MSVVIYHNGVLGTDSRGIYEKDGWKETIFEMQKLWVDEDRQVAFSLCGKNPNFFLRTSYRAILCGMVKEMDGDGNTTSLDLAEILQDKFGENGDISVMMMTRRELYGVDDKTIFKIDTDGSCMGNGNGFRIARMAIENGLSVYDACVLATRISPDCGGQVRVVSRKELKLIPKKRKNK